MLIFHSFHSICGQVLQEDLLELLGKAVTCAILGKAGQQRSRVLGLLIMVRCHFAMMQDFASQK